MPPVITRVELNRFAEGCEGFFCFCKVLPVGAVLWMTTLRQNFIRELVIRGIAPRTQESYVAAVYGLAKHYHQPPDQLSDEQLKQYVFYLAQERGLAPATLNLTVYALRSFYQLVLQRTVEQLRRCLPAVKQAVHRPQVFSVEEMEKLLTVGCLHPKHRAFLMTVYGAGLRLNEACHLKPAHIDSARMVIRVEEGKGRKDRYTLLSPRLLAGAAFLLASGATGPLAVFRAGSASAAARRHRAGDF